MAHLCGKATPEIYLMLLHAKVSAKVEECFVPLMLWSDFLSRSVAVFVRCSLTLASAVYYVFRDWR